MQPNGFALKEDEKSQNSTKQSTLEANVKGKRVDRGEAHANKKFTSHNDEKHSTDGQALATTMKHVFDLISTHERCLRLRLTSDVCKRLNSGI